MKKLAKLVLILAALMLCLSACGSVTTVDLSPYLSVSYSGFNGNGTARVDFGFASFEFGIMSQWKQNERADKLPGLTAVETTIAYAADVSQNLKNGDVITADAYMGKNINVRGIVDAYQGAYQLKVFTPEDITING